MDRLTKRNEADTAYYYPKCFEKCDGLGVTEKCNNCVLVNDVCEKLGDYEDSEEQGLLLKLPCKDVYYIVDKGTEYETVMVESIDNLNLYEIRGIDKDGRYWSTLEQAEKNLTRK